MKALVIYDSFFGNTEQVARSIASQLGPADSVGIVRVADVKPEQLKGIEVLIVGSPTRALQPSPATRAFLKSLPAGSLKGVKVAAFDTRINPEDTNSAFLKFLVKIFGYAAQPISNHLKKKGGEQALAPEGFYVKGTEGPLKDGELERAKKWASPAA